MKRISRLILLCLLCTFLTGILPAQTVEVLVNSRGSHAIQRYDAGGQFLGDFISASSGGLNSPEDILFHPDGTVLVTGFGNTAIKRYDGSSGAYLGEFSSGFLLSSPSKMSIGPDGLIYVTQWGSQTSKVVRFDLQGNFVDEFTDTPAPKGLGHVWDSQGRFYIALFGNTGDGTVHRYDSTGQDLGTFIDSAVLNGPTNIWWAGNGDLLVEDWSAGTILRYDTAGQYIGQFTSGLTNPEGIAFLPNGDLLVGDWGQDAVHRIDTGGTVLGLFCSGNGLLDPNCVRVREVTATAVQATEQPEVWVTPTVGRRFEIALPADMRDAEVRVLDAMGKTVYHFEGDGAFEAQGLAAGIYHLVAGSDRRRLTQVIVVR